MIVEPVRLDANTATLDRHPCRDVGRRAAAHQTLSSVATSPCASQLARNLVGLKRASTRGRA